MDVSSVILDIFCNVSIIIKWRAVNRLRIIPIYGIAACHRNGFVLRRVDLDKETVTGIDIQGQSASTGRNCAAVDGDGAIGLDAVTGRRSTCFAFAPGGGHRPIVDGNAAKGVYAITFAKHKSVFTYLFFLDRAAGGLNGAAVDNKLIGIDAATPFTRIRRAAGDLQRAVAGDGEVNEIIKGAG